MSQYSSKSFACNPSLGCSHSIAIVHHLHFLDLSLYPWIKHKKRESWVFSKYFWYSICVRMLELNWRGCTSGRGVLIGRWKKYTIEPSMGHPRLCSPLWLTKQYLMGPTLTLLIPIHTYFSSCIYLQTTCIYCCNLVIYFNFTIIVSRESSTARVKCYITLFKWHKKKSQDISYREIYLVINYSLKIFS